MASPVADLYSRATVGNVYGGRTANLDRVLPDFQNSGITVYGLSPTSYLLGWPHANDNVGVTQYEYSLDGGTNWNSAGTSVYASITGRTAATTDQVLVRAKDAAGNVSELLWYPVTLPAAGAPTWVIEYIGIGGDYATPAAWQTATALNLVGLNQGRLGLCLNQLFSSSGSGVYALNMQGASVDATRFRHLSAAPGCSFVDHPSRRSNPLRLDSSYGATISNAVASDSEDTATIRIQEGYAELSRLQVESIGNGTTTHGGFALHTSTQYPCKFWNLFLKTGSAEFVYAALGGHIISNSVILNVRPAGASGETVKRIGEMGLNGGQCGKAYYCAFISLFQIADAATSITTSNGYCEGCVFINCSRIDDVPPGTPPTYVNCYSNCTYTSGVPPSYPTQTARPGVTAIAFDTADGTGFENIAAIGTYDLRLKQTSGLRRKGSINTTYALRDIVGTVRPTTGAIDVGPWQTH